MDESASGSECVELNSDDEEDDFVTGQTPNVPSVVDLSSPATGRSKKAPASMRRTAPESRDSLSDSDPDGDIEDAVIAKMRAHLPRLHQRANQPTVATQPPAGAILRELSKRQRAEEPAGCQPGVAQRALAASASAPPASRPRLIKARQMAQKRIDLHWAKQRAGGFALSEVCCVLPAALTPFRMGTAAAAAPSDEDATYRQLCVALETAFAEDTRGLRFEGPGSSGSSVRAVPGLITWTRQTTQPGGQLSEERTLEPLAALFVPAEELVALASTPEAVGLRERLQQAASALPASVRLILVTFGVESAIVAAQRREVPCSSSSSSSSSSLSAGGTRTEAITPRQWQQITVDLMVAADIDTVATTTCSQLAEEILGLSRATAEAPAKQRPTALAAAHKPRARPLDAVLADMGVDPASLPAMPRCGSGEPVTMRRLEEVKAGRVGLQAGRGRFRGQHVSSRKVAGNDDAGDGQEEGGTRGGGTSCAEPEPARSASAPGNGDKDVREVFYAMLQGVTGVSAQRAASVVLHYPTFASLMRAYGDAELSEAEKQLLLADKMGKSNQATLSARVYRFFTSKDPEQLIV